MKDRLESIVDDTEQGLFFHKDSHHKYTLDESSLQNGAIYGLKQRRKSDSNLASKTTAGKLKPIGSDAEFESHIHDVAEVVYQRCGRRNRLKRVNAYIVELCVVLIREKVKVVAPARSVTCAPVGLFDRLDAMASTSVGGQKRKSPLPYTFPANKMSITLFGPIETQKRKNSVVTGVPSGKTNKDILFDLHPYIIRGDDD